MLNNQNIKSEICNIGFDTNYLDIAVKKHKFLSIKICGLTPVQATIIKQTALSKGADAAVHRDVLTQKIKYSDLILTGTIKQLENIAQSLEAQPFGLHEAHSGIKKQIKIFSNEYKPQIMGILNVTENSFSDGGKYLETSAAIEHGYKLIESGANIIDIGAESTKPGAKAVFYETEIQRLTSVVKELLKTGAKISIDTRNSKTAKNMINLGVQIINDVSGLDYDPKMFDLIKNSDVQIVVMHSKGTPETMDDLTDYKNICTEVFDNLQRKIELLNCPERTIIDVGFGFAKNINQNFELAQKISRFNSLGVKTLAGASRKRFLKSLLVNDAANEQLDDITALSSFYFFENKVDIVRVHNVQKTKLALDFYRRLQFN